ncbi:hypothetical protein FB451DRAFT_1500592 [Mycena latifolia]|nr:hypothetical protein FB451DRAFT_1500592 [Mycena latifolia]
MPLPSAQPLRRSTRNRAAPRNPDSPVTFVQREVDTITVSDSSDSDTASDHDARHIHDDLVQDLQAGIEASAIQQASDAFDTLAAEDTSTVIFGSPSPDPFDEPQEVERITPAAFEAMMRSLRENDGDTTHVHGRNREDSDDELGGPGGVTVESVDSGDGSLQDRADHLIQHIVRLQNRNPRDILPTQKYQRLSLPTYINSFRIIEDPTEPDTVFVRQSGWRHRGYLRTEIRERLQSDVVHYIDLVSHIIPDVSRLFPAVRPPVIALVRAHNSAFSLRFPHLTYRDLLEYLAGLQRSVAELQAYAMWYDRAQFGDIQPSTRTFELGLRGSVALSLADYNRLRRLGVPVWLEVASSDLVTPDRRKEVKRSPLHIETRTWDEMPVERALFASHRGKLVHNKPLEYYPPSVAAIYNYELAARGYAPRQDSFCRDLRSWQDVSKMVQESTPPNGTFYWAHGLQIIASDRAIAPVPDVVVVVSAKAKAEQSKWYRQYLDLRKREDVPWAPKSIEAWDMASLNSDYFPLLHNVKLEPKCKALLLYVAPPPHLFLGLKSEEKRNRYFFIWMCIRRAWLCQVSRNCDDPLFWGLTSQQWRDILSGEYWKYRHPKDSVSPFDARKFWIHGGPLFFPDDIGTSEGDISPEMNGSSTGRLEPFHFDDDGVKALVLWDLGLCHSQLQLDRADEILFAPTIVDGAAIGLRRGRRADVFYNPDWNWNIPNRLPPWEKPLHDAARRHWLSRLLEIIRDWPCASKMAWFLAENQFKSIVPRGGKSREAIFCAKLGDGKLQMLEWAMVAVYYQGVFDSLGILAIGVTKRPEPTIAMEPFYLM